MVVRSPEAFAAAVAAHRFGAYEVEANALAAARRVVASAGLLLVGEAHGVRETPGVLLALARSLDTRAVAFEWSWQELDEHVQPFVRSGALDVGGLWSLRPGAELFGGDGRVTAGHFALLERLRAEGRLEQVVLFDRLDSEPSAGPGAREREMAERLLAEWDERLPLLVLAGAARRRRDDGDATPAGPPGARRGDDRLRARAGLVPRSLQRARARAADGDHTPRGRGDAGRRARSRGRVTTPTLVP